MKSRVGPIRVDRRHAVISPDGKIVFHLRQRPIERGPGKIQNRFSTMSKPATDCERSRAVMLAGHRFENRPDGKNVARPF